MVTDKEMVLPWSFNDKPVTNGSCVGWGSGLVGKAPTVLAWRSEFGFPGTCVKT